MINDKKPLTMAEASQILGSLEENEKSKEAKSFIKKFSKMDGKKAKQLEEELTSLDLIKLKDKDIVKIVDLLPEDAQELNKIFTEVSLDADETNKILETVKKNK